MSAGYVVTDEWVHQLAASLDHPSVFMGGPSERNKKRAREALAAVIPAIQNAALERAAVDVEQWAAAVEAKAPASPTIIQAHMHAAAIRALKEGTRGEGDAVTAECRPPEGTPDGTVCVLQYGSSGVDYTPIWVTGAYHWPHPTIPGTVVAYMPEELAAAGWRFHSIAEPPADG